MLSIENHGSQVFSLFVCLLSSLYPDGLACISLLLPSEAGLLTLPFHEVCSRMVLLAPHTASFRGAQAPRSRGLWLGLLQDPAAISSSASASGQQGISFSVGHSMWYRGDSWMGSHLEVGEDQNSPSLLALKPMSLSPSICQDSSLEGRGKPARERAPCWGQRAGGGSWRPCDRWRLCVSQGRAGPLAHSCTQSEKASHDFSVGACVSRREERWEGGGSEFRIHTGNTKYVCESQADTHHMTPLAPGLANAEIRLRAQKNASHGLRRAGNREGH